MICSLDFTTPKHKVIQHQQLGAKEVSNTEETFEPYCQMYYISDCNTCRCSQPCYAGLSDLQQTLVALHLFVGTAWMIYTSINITYHPSNSNHTCPDFTCRALQLLLELPHRHFVQLCNFFVVSHCFQICHRNTHVNRSSFAIVFHLHDRTEFD